MYDPYYHFNVDADHTDDDVTGRLGTNWVKGTRAKVGYRDIRIYIKKKNCGTIVTFPHLVAVSVV